MAKSNVNAKEQAVRDALMKERKATIKGREARAKKLASKKAQK